MEHSCAGDRLCRISAQLEGTDEVYTASARLACLAIFVEQDFIEGSGQEMRAFLVIA
jgi:hypothetical protein